MMDRELIQTVDKALRGTRAGAASTKAPKVRRSRTLVCVLEGKSLVAYDYLGNHISDSLTASELAVLRVSASWLRPLKLVERVELDRAVAVRTIRRLVRNGFLVVEGTRAAAEDERFATAWEWDVRAGLFHLAIKDPIVMSEDKELEHIKTQIETREPVELYATNEKHSPTLALTRPRWKSGPLAILGKRRTRRSFVANRALTPEVVGECLFAGLGITGFVVDAVPKYGKLPLKLTPSGGARNPYEAYVLANNITGLARGFYHYSAIEHSLGLVASGPIPPASELLAGQDWYDRAPAIVFLVAHHARSQWKYKHPMVYRAVLVEAGHIGQNIMLAAAAHGLSSSPTALLSDRKIEQLLNIDHVMESVTYVIGVGHTNKRGADWGTFEAFP